MERTLTSNLKPGYAEIGVIAQTWNAIAWEAKVGRLLEVWGSLGYMVSSRSSGLYIKVLGQNKTNQKKKKTQQKGGATIVLQQDEKK